MSTSSFRPTAFFGAWSLALALVILLALGAESPRLFARTSVLPTAPEPVGLGASHGSRAAATDRDPSVPDASSVGIPAPEAGAPIIDTF